MKRFVLSFFVFLLIGKIYSQNITLGATFECPVVKDFNHQHISEELFINADYSFFETNAGVLLNSTNFQFVTSGFCMPNIIKGLKVGGGITYHFLNYEDIFTENDFLISARVRYTTLFRLSAEVAYSFIMKWANIKSVYFTSSNPLYTNSGLEILANYVLNEKWKFYLNITSFDTYDYPLLGTPFVKTGTEFSINEHVSTFADISLKFEDMFTSTTYLSGMYFRIGGSVRIW